MEILLTGFAAIDAGGPCRGLPAGEPVEPAFIEKWPTTPPRRAFLVPSFRPADVVPGLRTRRMDRLSVWALVGAALALDDAGIEPAALDGDRTAVVFGTALGCLDLTQTFFAAVAVDAPRADPIVFPETLASVPAGHVARHFGLRGPNLTISAGLLSGEAALLQAVGLLRSGESDRVVVIAGDTLTQALHEWYEAAGVLSDGSTAVNGPPAKEGGPRCRLVPGEGLVACVLETQATARPGVTHGRYRAGWLGSLPVAEPPLEDALAIPLGPMLADAPAAEVLAVSPTAEIVTRAVMMVRDRAGAGTGGSVRSAPPIQRGHFGASGLLQVGMSLSYLRHQAAVALVTSALDPDRQCALLLLAPGDRA